MRYLSAFVCLAFVACNTPTAPSERPSFIVDARPVCPVGTHKKITAVSFYPPPARVIAWICVPN